MRRRRASVDPGAQALDIFRWPRAIAGMLAAASFAQIATAIARTPS
jgi:hypothetical protein